jgi:hypothetical protein
MRCEKCQGEGFILRPPDQRGLDVSQRLQIIWPCPDCNGCGIGHCCDGLRAQREEPEE